VAEPLAWTLTLPQVAVTVAVAYLIGSVPFGLILARIAGVGDIRRIGSGNIGATNVLRTGRKSLAAATLLLDTAKGAAGPLLAAAWFAEEAALIAAVAAVVGHMFPVWLNFRGGKGVATGLGALLALSWPSALIAGAVWLLVAVTIRISSLAALVTTALAPFHVWFFAGPWTALTVAVVCILIWTRHRENIARLLRGEESRIGGRTK